MSRSFCLAGSAALAAAPILAVPQLSIGAGGQRTRVAVSRRRNSGAARYKWRVSDSPDADRS